MMRTAHQRASDKGHRIEQLAKRMFENQGYLVETAPKVVRWLKLPGQDGLKPRSSRHDFFGVWDLIIVLGPGLVQFVQVTDEHNVSARRKKILASGFPHRSDDLLLAYAGRGRFRVFMGPTFAGETTAMCVPRLPPKKKVVA